MNILRSLGKAELAKLNEEVTFSGTVDVIDTYIYRQDYNVGDIVAIKNKFGISITALITEVMESEDNENGYEVEPVFSYNHNAPTFENSYILTESNSIMMTEAAVALISEAGISTASSKKISELPQTTTIQDESCFPIVQDDVTRKINFKTLKEQLEKASDFSKDIGDGRKSYTLTHSLGSNLISVKVYPNNGAVLPSYEVTGIDENSIQIDFLDKINNYDAKVVITNYDYLGIGWENIHNLKWMDIEAMINILEEV